MRGVREVGLVVAAVACGAAPASPPGPRELPSSHVEATEKLPPLFAPLFEDGRSWRFTIATVDGDHGRARSTGAMSCRVRGVSRVRGAWVSDVACDGDDDHVSSSSRPEGRYVATAAALWRVDAQWSGDPASLVAGDALLAASPVAGTRERPTSAFEGETESLTVQPHHGGWCVFHSGTGGGDAYGWSLCLRADVGLLGGGGFFQGNALVETEWGDRPASGEP